MGAIWQRKFKIRLPDYRPTLNAMCVIDGKLRPLDYDRKSIGDITRAMLTKRSDLKLKLRHHWQAYRFKFQTTSSTD